MEMVALVSLYSEQTARISSWSTWVRGTVWVTESCRHETLPSQRCALGQERWHVTYTSSLSLLDGDIGRLLV